MNIYWLKLILIIFSHFSIILIVIPCTKKIKKFKEKILLIFCKKLSNKCGSDFLIYFFQKKDIVGIYEIVHIGHEYLLKFFHSQLKS